MSQISIDIVSQIPRLFKEIKDLASAPAEKRKEECKSFFSNEIEPINKEIVEIYNDYS